MLPALSVSAHVPVLYVLAPSHYCERARWALDRRGVAYTERRLALGPHALHLRAKGLTDTALPVLDIGSKLVQGSGRILDLCDFPTLDPAFERRVETTIGCLVRRFIYAAAFTSPNDGGVVDILLDGVCGSERLAAQAAWPIVKRRLATAFGARADDLPMIIEALGAELDWVDAQVRDVEGPLGEPLGRIDITVASLLAPIARPPEGPVKKRLNVVGLAAEVLHEWSTRPSLRWTKATYARYRAEVDAVPQPVRKVRP